MKRQFNIRKSFSVTHNFFKLIFNTEKTFNKIQYPLIISLVLSKLRIKKKYVLNIIKQIY